MKKQIFLLFSLLACITVKSSGQNRIWTLPGSYITIGPGVPASSQPLPVSDYTGAPAQYAHNAMHDAQGNLLFFVVDGKVYDKNGTLMAEFYYPGFDIVAGTSEVLIVPMPGSCTQYCIQMGGLISSSANASAEPFYGILDMNAPYLSMTIQRLFTLVPSNLWDYTQFPTKYARPMMAATQIQPDGNRLLFVEAADNVYRFRIAPSGISYLGYFALPGYSGPTTNLRAELEIAQLPGGGFQLAAPYMVSNGISVYCAQLNASGVLVSGTAINLTDVGGTKAWIHGLEFSPSGRYL